VPKRLSYRANRVRVTKNIEEAVYWLIKTENDTEKKKKHPAKWYREEVAKKLSLSESNNPSLRSYEVLIAKFKEQLKIKDPLDQPWCLGASIKEHISPEITPVIFEMLRSFPVSDILTVRIVRWIAHLYPPISELLHEEYPDDRNRQLACVGLLAREYAIREELSSNVKDEAYPDTHDMDRLFFILGDLSDDALAAASADNIFWERPKGNKLGLSVDELKELRVKLGDNLSTDLVKFIDEYVSIYSSIEQKIFFHEHLNEVEQVAELQEKMKAVNNNERSHNKEE